jgi:hypothetical protein
MFDNFFSTICLCINQKDLSTNSININNLVLNEKEKENVCFNINNNNKNLNSSSTNEKNLFFSKKLIKDNKNPIRSHIKNNVNNNKNVSRRASVESLKLINQKKRNKHVVEYIENENKIFTDFLVKVDDIINECVEIKSVSESSDDSKQ